MIVDSSEVPEKDQDSELLEKFEKSLGRVVTRRELLFYRQIKKALAGDTFAFNAILDREEGKPAQYVANKNVGSYEDFLKDIGDDEDDE
jgi:hypothetical protein